MDLSPDEFPDGYSLSPLSPVRKSTPLSSPSRVIVQNKEMHRLRGELEKIIYPYISVGGSIDTIVAKHIESMRKKVTAAFEKNFKIPPSQNSSTSRTR